MSDILAVEKLNYRSPVFWARSLVIALILLFFYYKTDVSSTVGYFTFDLLKAVLLIQPIVLLSLAIVTVRFRLLLSAPDIPPIPFFKIFKAVILGLGLGVIIPARGSEFVKVIYLRNNASVPAPAGMAAMVLERTTDVIIVGLMGIISIGLTMTETNWKVFAGLMAFCVATLALLPRLESAALKIVSALPWEWTRNLGKGMVGRAVMCVKEGRIYSATAVGVGAWGLSYISFYILINMAGSVPVSPAVVLGVFAVTSLGGAVPALPGGFGAYEAAAVVTLKAAGYGFDEALALALTLHMSQLVTIFALSIIIVTTEKTGISALVAQVKNFRNRPGAGAANNQ